MWLWQTHHGCRSESYCRTAVPPCEAEIPVGHLWAWGTFRFSMVALYKGPLQPGLQNTAAGLPAGTLRGLASAGVSGEAVTGPLEESVMAQLSQGLQFLCWGGWQLKCWWDCKAESMPTWLELYACHDRGCQEVWFVLQLKCICSTWVKVVVLKYCMVGVVVRSFSLLLLH